MKSKARIVSLCVFPALLFAFSGLAATSSFGAESGDKNQKDLESIQQSETTPYLTTVAETGYLELEQGFVGDKLGAEIEQISIDESEQFQTVEISIPVENPEDIDRVQVIGPAGKPIPQFKPAQISRDHDASNVGIKLYLSQKKSWTFKLKLVDDSRENPPRY